MKVLAAMVGGFVAMEGFSWLMHKYVMHGPLWRIHQTHHMRKKGFFELNDLFSLVFGSLAVLLILRGLHQDSPYVLGTGLGISVYGLMYFLLHDIIIHRRIKMFGRMTNPYLQALAAAHRDHHRTHQRDGAVAFGLLWVPFRYFKKQKREGRLA